MSPLAAGSGAAGPRDCGSGIFIVKGVDRAGDRGSGDITVVDVDTVLVAFLDDFHT